MYLCIYVYLYLCICASMCLCVYVSYLCIYVSMCLCIYACVYVYIYIYIYTLVYMYILGAGDGWCARCLSVRREVRAPGFWNCCSRFLRRFVVSANFCKTSTQTLSRNVSNPGSRNSLSVCVCVPLHQPLHRDALQSVLRRAIEYLTDGIGTLDPNPRN